MLAEAISSEDQDLLSQVRIIGEREPGKVLDAYVPLALITVEDVSVDPTHVANLKKDILRAEEEGRQDGLTSAINVAHIAGFSLFPTVDGYHRLEAFRQLQRPEIYSTVELGVSWGRVYDSRILAAALHQSVRFGRIIDWVRDSWNLEPWSKVPLNLQTVQAFSLSVVSGMTGERMGLSEVEAEAIRTWVEEKSRAWQISASTVYQYLVKTEGVSGKLIRMVQDRKPGEGEVVLTQGHIAMLGKHLATLYDYQELVAEAALDNKLNPKQTGLLAEAVSMTVNLKDAKSMVKIRTPFILTDTAADVAKRIKANPRSAIPRNGGILTDRRREAFKQYHYLVEATVQMEERLPADIVRDDYFAVTGEKLIANQSEESKPKVNVFEVDDRLVCEWEDGRRLELNALEMNYSNLEDGPIHLTPNELKVLRLLITNHGHFLTQQQILRACWGATYTEETHLLRVNISRLRSKLGSDKIIETIQGRGYRFLE